MKSTTRSLRLLPAMLAAAVTLLWHTPALAVVIDSFTTNQPAVTDPPGTAPTVVTGGADIIGTRRALASDLLAVGNTIGPGPVTSTVTGGNLTLTVMASTPDSRGEAIVTWDGDVIAGNLNPTGLAAQNLTAASHNALRIRVISASAGTEIVVDVYSSATAVSRGFLRIPTVIAAPTDLFLTYQYDFVQIGATPADFTSVGAIQMRLRGTEVSASINEIDTIGPTVTGSKRDLELGGSPIAAPVLEGATFKYRITVAAQNGLADNLDLSDTVDANTALNAASIRVTPVAIDDSYVTAGHVGRSIAAPGLLANDIDPDTAGTPPELVIDGASVGTFATALGGSITIAADGSFSYEPPVGVGRAVDTFTYTVLDNDGQTSTGLVKMAIGPRIWFVDDVHPGTNVGTRSNPFVTFTALNVNGAGGVGDQDAIGDIIFLLAGNHTAAVKLEADQWLIGEGEGLTVDNQVIVAPGTDPVLASPGGAGDHGVALAAGNTLRGFTIGNTGTNFDIQGINYGTLTVSNLVLNGTGGGIVLTTGAVNATFDSIESTSGTHGIALFGTSGTLTVNGATSVSNTTRGIENGTGSTTTLNFNGQVTAAASAGTAILSVGGTLNFTGTSNSATATGGAAIDLANTSLGAGATFATVSATTAASKGVNLDNVSGAFTGTGGAIVVNPGGGNAFDVNAGSSNVTYGGTVTSTAAARLVEVTSRTGGTVALSGNLGGSGAGHTGINVASNTGGTINFSAGTKTINSSTNNAVTLATNTGATINFTGGGLALSTTSGSGFSATGGATAITVQGSANTIASGTGTALNVASTTIGAAGLTFQSIAANGAANGISLASTGTTGRLVVTGTGGAASGGTIQNTTGAGVLLQSTANVSLTRMQISNTGSHGISGLSLLDGTAGAQPTFELVSSRLTSPGDADNETAIFFGNSTTPGNSTGKLRIADTIVEQFEENGIEVYNNTGTVTLEVTGTLSGLTDSTTKFDDNNDTHGQQGILTTAAATATVITNVSGVYFNNIESAALDTRAEGTTATIDVNWIGNVSINGGGPDNFPSGGGFQIIQNQGGNATFDIKGNNIRDLQGDGVVIIADGPSMGRIGGPGPGEGNVISGSLVGDGVRIDTDQLPGEANNFVATILIQNNSIGNDGTFPGLGDDGIQILNRDGTKTLNLTIEGNTVANSVSEAIRYFSDADVSDGPLQPKNSVRVVGNAFTNIGVSDATFFQAQDSAQMCLHMASNTFTGTNRNISLNQSTTSQLQITQASVAAVATANTGSTSSSTGTITFGGTCTNPPLPTNP